MGLVAKHFSALTMCPYGAFSLGGETEMVCHCLVVETKHGLVLVDCGLFAKTDFEVAMRTPKYFLTLMRLGRDRDATCAHQIEKLGYHARDVRHVICTHLDLDHVGGISDFPDAEIHVTKAEREAAETPRTGNEKRRYIQSHWSRDTKWRVHETSGETWKGFSSVRALAEDDPDVLIVPLPGHTRGHAAIAVRAEDGWLLHCGDAYFHADEMTPKAAAPWGFELFERNIAVDDRARRENQKRLRELKTKHDDVRVFCAHSKPEFSALVK